MGLSTMRPKKVRKGSEIPAKGRIDVFMRVGMQNSSSPLTQKRSNGRCQKTPVTGRPAMSVRSVIVVPPKAPKKSMESAQLHERHAQLLTFVELCSTEGFAAPPSGTRRHPSNRG